MAFDTYTARNREIEVPLAIEYSREIADASWAQNPTYRYFRRVRKAYSYKGLSEPACASCVADMRRIWLRKIMNWTQIGSTIYSSRQLHLKGGGYDRRAAPDTFVPVADVSVTRRDVVFDVRITVDETISICHKTAFDVTNATQRASLERQFLLTDLSYISTYSYDDEEDG